MTITIDRWETISTDNDRMTGRFAITLRVTGVVGFVTLEGELRSFSKTDIGLPSLVGSRSGAVRRPGVRGLLELLGRRP